MIGALWNGMSGIIAHERGIAVESNNAANISTVGHKKDSISFEDILYSQSYGRGVNVESISKQFGQGNITPTNSNIDVAIDGKGFFIVQDKAGKNFYTRAGNFIQAEDGFLKTQDSLNIMGLIPQQKRVISSNPAENIFTDDYIKNLSSITVNSNTTAYNINARATNYINSAQSDLMAQSGDNYKTSGTKISDVEATLSDYNQKLKLFQTSPNATSTPSTNQISKIDYSNVLSDLNNENDFISVTIDNNVVRQNFDTDLATTLKKLSDKVSNLEGFSSIVDATTGVFTIEKLVPGKEFKVYDAIVNNNNTLSQVNTTKAQDAKQGSGLAMIESSRDALKKALERADAKFLEVTNILSYGANLGFTASGINTRLDAQTLVKDAKGDITISDDGFVFVGIEGNKFLVGKIGTANFKNEDGLKAEGNNLYSATKESGPATNADNTNKLISNFLENANVNMGDTLSMLMIYQKAFEANSKSITTSDEFLQTAMNMIK